MRELDSLKTEVRKLGKIVREAMEYLEEGGEFSAEHLYEHLTMANGIVKGFNRSLRDLGKTLDKHQEV